MNLICPNCGKILQRDANQLRCDNRHCFDIARQGYINLLTVQQKHSLHPGDTREQVAARRAFLDSGAYAPIVEALIDAAKRHNACGPILDLGCGEGYYSAQLAQSMNAELTGVDISKDAVRYAAAKYKHCTWLCATAAHVPVADHSAGTLTSLFSITLPEEFLRCIVPDGLFFQVLAAEDHLLALKRIIYPELKWKDKVTQPELTGFTLLESIPIRFTFTVESEQVQNLLYMTPHVYRISKAGAEKLAQTSHLTDTASCILNIYKPE